MKMKKTRGKLSIKKLNKISQWYFCLFYNSDRLIRELMGINEKSINILRIK